MQVQLEKLNLECSGRGDIQVSFHEGKIPGASCDHSVLVIRYEGVYPIGSAGNSDAAFMVAVSKSACAAFHASALVLDMSHLEYEWGDALFGVIRKAIFPQTFGADLPTAVLVGPKSRKAIGTLIHICGGASSPDACENECFLDSLDDAWEYLRRRLNEAGSTARWRG